MHFLYELDLLNPSKTEAVSVEDILSFPMNDEKPTFLCNVGRTSSRVSVGTQTKSMVCVHFED